MFWGGFPWCLGGFGRGWRHMYYATGLPGWMRAGWWPISFAGVGPWPEAEQQVEWLKQEAKLLESQLKAIRTQIERLEKKKGAQQEEGE